jgi:uncharacterized protein (TIGR02246 family)
MIHRRISRGMSCLGTLGLTATLLAAVGPGDGASATFEDAGRKPDATGAVAFVGVSVLPMTGGEPFLADQTVVVADGKIVAVGRAGQVHVPEGSQVISGADLWLLPGLAEMHAHLPGPGFPDEEMDKLLFLYLANGVTTIRTMLGAPNHLVLRDQIAAGERLGPRVIAAAPSLSGQSAPTPDAAERAVLAHAAAGYDLLKLHPQLSRATFDRIVEVARNEGITWAGHVSVAVGLEHSLATGKSTIDHLDGYLEAAASDEVRARVEAGEVVPMAELVESITTERIREIARNTADAGVWNVPTMYLWENFYNERSPDELAALPEMRYASPQVMQQWRRQKEGRMFVELLENWRTNGALGAADLPAEVGRQVIEFRREMLAALHESGAPLLLGTDSPQMFMVPGFALHHEIRALAASGVPPLAILESGSRNVARYAAEELGHDELFGSIVEGARADLILVQGNPLDDLSRLEALLGVMVGGRWLPLDVIRARLDAAAERAEPAQPALEGAAEPESEIRAVWAALDERWNARDAEEFSALFSREARFGFVDRGESLDGRGEILRSFSERFPTFAPEVRHRTTVHEVRTILPELAVVDGGVEILRLSVEDGTDSAVILVFATFALMHRGEEGWVIRELRVFELPLPEGS